MGPNEASWIVIGAAMKVHSALGARVLESVCDTCPLYELTQAGLHFEHQVRLPVVYSGIHLSSAYRVDFIVENCLIVELKCVEKLLPVHSAQVLPYLKLSGLSLGLLLNFNVPHMRQGFAGLSMVRGLALVIFLCVLRVTVPTRRIDIG